MTASHYMEGIEIKHAFSIKIRSFNIKHAMHSCPKINWGTFINIAYTMNNYENMYETNFHYFSKTFSKQFFYNFHGNCILNFHDFSRFFMTVRTLKLVWLYLYCSVTCKIVLKTNLKRSWIVILPEKIVIWYFCHITHP